MQHELIARDDHQHCREAAIVLRPLVEAHAVELWSGILKLPDSICLVVMILAEVGASYHLTSDDGLAYPVIYPHHRHRLKPRRLPEPLRTEVGHKYHRSKGRTHMSKPEITIAEWLLVFT